MELSVWKTLLLKWVKQCNFTKDFSCLEDSNIEAFFLIFALHAQVELPTQQSPNSTAIGALQKFLKEFYPDFTPYLEYDGRVVSEDYIYVYTLLMHYACVQYPSEYFHNICKNLPESMQTSIEAFLQQTVNRPELTRNRLRQTIVNVQNSIENLFSHPVPFLVPDSTPLGLMHLPSSCSPTIATVPDYDIKADIDPLMGRIKINSTPIDSEANAIMNSVTLTPVQQERFDILDASQVTAPPTPKTELLEQRNREVLGLRAQLETERYEKTVLEEQISENEHMIKSLSKENKVKKMQLAKLTTTLTTENGDEDSYARSCVHNEFENVRQRLLKELSNKDAVLAEKTEEMQELKEEHCKVVNMFKVSEKQLLVCMDRISELELSVENLTTLLADKADEIASLQRDKLELQQCLQETRDELHNGREVLNASSDLLDTTQSIGSLNTTPDNLASIVIDKQLWEKEQENCQLRELLTDTAQQKTRTLEKLLQLAKQYQLKMSDAPENSQLQLLNLIGHRMDELSFNYEHEKQRVMELQEQNNTLMQQNIRCEEKSLQLKNEVKLLDQKFTDNQSDLLASTGKLQRGDEDIKKIKINKHQVLEKKNLQLAHVDCDLMQARSFNCCLEMRISSEVESSISQRQQLEEINTLVQCQEKQIKEQRKQLNDAHQNLKCFLVNFISQVDVEMPSSPNFDENCLEELASMILRRLESLCTQLEESKTLVLDNEQKWNRKHEGLMTKLAATNEQLAVQDVAAMDMLETLNSYTKKTKLTDYNKTDNYNADNNGFPNNFKQLCTQLTQFFSTHKQLEAKCNSLHSQCITSVEKINHLKEMLRTERTENYTKLTDTTAQLQKSTECEGVVQKLQLHKLLLTTAQNTHNGDFIEMDKMHKNQMQEHCEASNQPLEVAEQKLREQKLYQARPEKELRAFNVEHTQWKEENIKKTNDQSEIILQLEQELTVAKDKHIQLQHELKVNKKRTEEQDKKKSQLEQELSEQSIKQALLELQLKTANEKQTQLEAKLKTVTENANEQKKEKLELQQQLLVVHQELSMQKLQVHKAAKHKQTLLEKELSAGTEKIMEQKQLEVQEIILQTLQEQKKEQTQHLEKGQKELKQSQEQLQKALQREKQQIELRLEVKQSVVSETELKNMKDMLAEREKQLQKSNTQLDKTTKRLEKMAIKLGEQQADLSKMQRELAQTKLKQDEQADQLCILQNDKVTLQSMLHQREEYVNRAEEKLTSLEKLRALTETECVATDERVLKLEKARENAVKMMRELQQQVHLAEQDKVRLNLEVGGLNSEIVLQKKRSAQLESQLKLATEALTEMRCPIPIAESNHNPQLDMIERKYMREQIDTVQVKLTEALQELDGTQLIHDSVQCELEDKTRQLELEREKSSKRETQYLRKINTLNEELDKCNADLIDMRNSRVELLDTLEKEKKRSDQLHKVHEQITQQRAKAQQLELDCQILQAKYHDAKEEIGRCEKKLKDQRLEMEGKLEKMKTKMRTLYTTEVNRMKEKQERDVVSNKVELEKLCAQNTKYEEHTRKLSIQIVRLNEKILEQQKQHTILSTDLRHLQQHEQAATAASTNDDWQPFKRPSAPSANLGSNLAMEDEEGEVFNNTYLTDLKLGRVPDMTAEELQHRNSLQLPHLKSAYAAQYDLCAQEDDLKEKHTLDDSMSALLSTTGGNGIGTRKKSLGTHYKRPGPPTPSKNGGRLSFGSSEPSREILRETCDNNGTSKTPARFKIFASRFSMGSNGISGGGHCLPRDENSPPKRRLSNIFKRK